MGLLIKLITWLHNYCCSYLVDTTNAFFSYNLVYLALFAISLVYLSNNKKSTSSVRCLLFYSTLSLLFFIVYSPFLSLIILKLPNSNSSVVSRLWVICPIWIVMSYAFVCCVRSIKNKLWHIISILFILGVLILTGNSTTSLNMVRTPKNYYKINTESITLVDEVLSLSDGQPVSIYILVPSTGGDLENYVVGGSIYQGMNQYSGLIDIHSDAYTEDDWESCFVPDIMPDGENSTEDYINYFFSNAYNNLNCDYVVFPNDERVNSKIDHLGYCLVGSTDNYNIYSASR